MTSPYSRNATYLLALFGGTLGLHRFYTGNYFTGALMLLTGGGFGLWWLLDLALIASNQFRDGQNRIVPFLNENKEWPKLSLAITGITLISAASPMLASMFIGEVILGVGLLVAGIASIATALARLDNSRGYSSTVIVPSSPTYYSGGSTVTIMPSIGLSPTPTYVQAATPVAAARPQHHHVGTGLGHTFGFGHGGGNRVAVSHTSVNNHHGGHGMRAGVLHA